VNRCYSASSQAKRPSTPPPSTYAIEFLGTSIKVNAASLGDVATDLNDHQGQIAVEDEDSVAAVARPATLPADGPTGEFPSNEGQVSWWTQSPVYELDAVCAQMLGRDDAGYRMADAM
jgi:hypothetical protein